jgi:glycosyltransferase involved in cell wall biosynthesis
LSERLRLSVVIPHLNQPLALDRCLRSLAAGSRQADEIIVVDNGSVELPGMVCAAYSGVRLLQEDLPGPGPARNRGAGASTGDILAFTDADCIVDRDWLAAIERAFADPTLTIIGGDVRVAIENPKRLTMIEAYESVFGYQVERYINKMGFTVTCNLAMRPAILADVGPFGGLAISEDRDWGQRATARGHAIHYRADVVIFHPARRDFTQLTRKWDRHMGHDFAEAREHPSGRLRFLVKTVAMAPSALIELPRILRSDRIHGLRSRVLAFAGLARIRAYRAGKMAWLLIGGDPRRLSGAWNREK